MLLIFVGVYLCVLYVYVCVDVYVTILYKRVKIFNCGGTKGAVVVVGFYAVLCMMYSIFYFVILYSDLGVVSLYGTL